MAKPEIVVNHRDNADLRNMYFHFTETVFPSVSFRAWCEKGWWSKNYKPYSIVQSNKIVSNVSVSEMEILVGGISKTGIQLGAVGTIPEYENKGLSRHLMEYVLNKYDETSDFIFLFANDSVLDFYPKFGFRPVNEVLFQSTSIPKVTYAARKLDLSDENDSKLIRGSLSQRHTLTRLFGANNYDFVTHWHLINIFPDNILYIEDDGVICLCKEENRQLHLWEVISKEPIDMKKILPKIINNKDLKEILYYFPPDQASFVYDKVIEDKESHLFVRGEFEVEGKDFKFPITAQT
jgi:GNAT superfamily N-acetyltransferase